MTTVIWSLCLLFVAGALRAVHTSPVRKTSKMEDKKAAPQEEVNVVMFGVIQFSESLKYTYETTDAKIAKINQSLKNHEGTLQKLGKQTEEAAEVEKQMKEEIWLLQAQMEEQQAQTKMTKDWLTSMEKEELELRRKVNRLEMYLNNSAPPSVTGLQEKAKEHGHVLKGLQLFIEFQRENIESQNDQILKLQKMREAMT